MPPDRHFILKSLAQVEQTLAFLKELSQRSEQEYLQSLEARFSSAYGLMTAIEGVSGVAAHVIATSGFPVPQGAADSFRVLLDKGVLQSYEHVENLQAMSRFRNLIVHRYWEVDYRIVRRIMLENLVDIERFSAEMTRYLDSLEASP